MKMENLGWLYGLGGVIALGVFIGFCIAFKNCAESKGYFGMKYFWLCFVFGILGFLYIAALPDINYSYKSYSRKIDSNKLSEMANEVEGTSENWWRCTKCGETNATSAVICKGCGKYK